ncbi:hypothetical protein SporoP8_12550 [Sporosarcina ureae]|nr:hypothetical protein SporoP8_12550 [Sporosarcina ureae]
MKCGDDMKVCFFSDIHGNLYAFEEFLRQSDQLEIDQYIFCGDVFGYYYDQNAILSKLRSMKNLHAVKGNHDQYYLDYCLAEEDEDQLVKKYGNSYKGIMSRISADNQVFIENMPDSLILEMEGKRMGVFHGSVSDPINGRVYPDTTLLEADGYETFDYVIHGHTHYRMVRNLQSTTVINPGSIGQPRDTNGFSFATLTLPNGTVEFQEILWDRQLLIRDIETYDAGNQKLIDILFRNGERNHE